MFLFESCGIAICSCRIRFLRDQIKYIKYLGLIFRLGKPVEKFRININSVLLLHKFEVVDIAEVEICFLDLCKRLLLRFFRSGDLFIQSGEGYFSRISVRRRLGGISEVMQGVRAALDGTGHSLVRVKGMVRDYRPLIAILRELGADGINLIPVDDHCGAILSMRKKDIAMFNNEIAPRIAERALALGLIISDEDAFPFGRTDSEIRLGRAGRYAFGYYDTHPCYAPWTHSLIDFDGNVYVCCMTRERIPPLGNIRNQTFKEIWEDAAYRQIRLRMHPPSLAACKRCDDFIEQNKSIWETIGPY